jgi:hypothetical protein
MRAEATARLGWFGRGLFALCTSLLLLGSALALPVNAFADATDDSFSLQVSPSPLTATIKPGQRTSLDLQIRNTSTRSQALKMDLRSFAINDTTGDVKLGTDAPRDVVQFVSFSNPMFDVQAGQIFTQHLIINTPASAGFTYSFAVTISQQNPPKAQQGSSAVRGSVAVFTLLNVDRPGATRKLELNQFSVAKHVYEYLPASISVKLKNAGNTLVQPSGNIFIQRHSNDTTPLATIQVNQAGGYILPGSSRVLTTSWNDGFPHYQATTDCSGKTANKLSWTGGDFTKLRFGRYTAKLVAVYNDGEHDVPINAEVTFWVIPWRIILGILVLLLIIIIGIWTIFRNSTRALKRGTKRDAATKP